MDFKKLLTKSLITGLAVGVFTGCATANEKAAAPQKAAAAATAPAAQKYGKPGFYTELDKDGRLWIFQDPSKALDDYKAKGKPAKHVVRPGGGPDGLTLKAVDFNVINAYAASKPGFHTEFDKDGRLWIFADPSKALDDYKAKGKPAKHVVRPGAGPGGVTVKAVDFDTINAYMTSKPGFYTALDKDGRLWVFKSPSKELDAFKAKGKPAKHVVRPGAGPMGITLKAVDFAVLDAYQAAR